jgi:hypothetical protein
VHTTFSIGSSSCNCWETFTSIGASSSSSSYIDVTERDEDKMASSTMVQSLLASTKNKTIVQNNNLGLAFERKMILLFENSGHA